MSLVDRWRSLSHWRQVSWVGIAVGVVGPFVLIQLELLAVAGWVFILGAALATIGVFLDRS